MSVIVLLTGIPLHQVPLTMPSMMREVGELMLSRIRSRTKKGIDANGRSFRPLSPIYAAAKRKALGHSRADLTVSGRMLADIGLRPEKSKVSLYFTSSGGKASGRTLIQRSRSVGAADKAYWHNESGAGRSRVIRAFFDLNREDEQAAIDLLTRRTREL